MSVYQELGAKLREFMLDKTEEVDDKVEAIDKHERYVNTDLDSCFCALNTEWESVKDTYIPFVLKSGNMNIRNGLVTVEPGKRIQITLHTTFQGVSTDLSPNLHIALKDHTNDIVLASFNPINNGKQYQGNQSHSYQYTNETDSDVEIGYYIVDVYVSDVFVNTTLSVQEIGRQIVIDPVEHVNDSQGIEDTPVGHVIAHMGTVAPKHYLICDGTEYNIADYPYLAQHIEDNFGSINFFGGDGESTFAVPDLRGEFLRGTGTATRNSGTGAAVGQHQNGTTMPNIWLYHNTNEKWQLQAEVDPSIPSGLRITSGDKYYAPSGSTRFNLAYSELTLNKYTGNPDSSQITVRPTNTSVLYCIKYEPTYFMNTYNTNYMQPSLYSEEEKVIGCWINGKPLYEKTIVAISPDVKDVVKNIITLDESIESVISLDGYMLYVSSGNTFNIPLTVPKAVKSGESYYYSSAWTNIDAHTIHMCVCEKYINLPVYITIQYTKTADTENSFTNDMLKNNYVELTYSDEEISTMVANILGGEE